MRIRIISQLSQRQLPPASSKKALAGLFVLLLALSGCHSVVFSDYTTPAILGRVLAADTRQPLAGVKVIRVQPGQSAFAGNSAKGAELMQQPRPEITGADGGFVLTGREYFSVFNWSSRWSGWVAFSAAGYAAFQTNYTTADIVSNSSPGTPLVQAGDILLQPLAR